MTNRKPQTKLSGALSMLFACLALAVAGCRSNPENPVQPPAPAVHETGATGAHAAAKAELYDQSPLVPRNAEQDFASTVPFSFPQRQPEPPLQQLKPAEYPAKLLRNAEDPEKIIKDFALAIDAGSINDLVATFADASCLGFNYYIDPSLKGSISIKLKTDMKAGEAWALFEHLLWQMGAYATESRGGYIQIMPFSKMPTERGLLTGKEPVPNVEVAFLTIKNTKSSEIVPLIKPFMTEGATIVDVARLNTLLIVEAPANMPKLRELINQLDAKGEGAWPHIIVRCEQVDADVLREELELMLPILGITPTNKTPSFGQLKLIALPRLQAIVASAALPDVLEEVGTWIRALDREDTAEKENIFFYNVKHTTAEHLSEALTVFFPNTTSRATQSASTTRSVSSRATPTAGAATPALPAAPAASSSRPNRAADGPIETIFDTPVIVFADGILNRLTIRTTQRAYAMVEALLNRIDLPPRQVMIRGVIAEINLNHNTEYGFSYAAANYINNDKFNFAISNLGFPDLGTGTDAVGANLRGLRTGTAMMFQDSKNGDYLGFIRAVAGKENVRILLAPQIMAANDQEAVINIGDKVPIVTGDQRDLGTTTTTGSVYRNIQYQDTGVILTVKPHITAGNEVRLDVKQEASQAVVNESSGIDSPTIRTRLLQTTLMIPDSGTALLGGLIRTSEDDSHTGVPLLKDIPLLGRLFRTNTKRLQRTELLVLITVNVVDRQTAIEDLAGRYQAALKEIRSKMDF